MNTPTRCLLCILALLLLASCSAGPVDIEAINAEETYPNGMGCLVFIADSVEDIYHRSDLVLECTVTSFERTREGEYPPAYSTVTVQSVFKGTPQEDTLRIGLDLAVGPLEEGAHMVLFLVDSQLYEGLFYITGAFQGRFIEREGYYFQQATEEVKLSLEEYYPLAEEAFFHTLRTYGDPAAE